VHLVYQKLRYFGFMVNVRRSARAFLFRVELSPSNLIGYPLTRISLVTINVNNTANGNNFSTLYMYTENSCKMESFKILDVFVDNYLYLPRQKPC
jgi:hypothetical protein